MESNNVKKIGFISSVGICLGSIVGIGIFLKNGSVGRALDGNGISWLITWIISGLIALLVAFHFGKISQIESKDKTSGLSFWTNTIVSKKHKWFKNIVTINYSFFYSSILVISLSFFTSELLVAFINEIVNVQLDVWVYVLISLGFIIFFVLVNFFSVKSSGYISLTTTILKFIPLIMVIFIGIIFANTHNLTNSNGNSTSVNGFNQTISFQKAIQGIMISIPAVLFSFDSFVGIGALSKHVKGGHKTVSKVIVTSIIVATIIYLLICIASILHFNENTTVLNVLIDSLPKSASKGITIFVAFFLFVSAFGTTNGITSAFVYEIKNVIYEKRFIGINKLVTKIKEQKAALFLSFLVLAFWSIVMFVPSIIINNDGLVDGFSNLIVVYFFLVYAFLIYQYWKNIYLIETKKTNDKKRIGYSILVWISVASVVIAISLNIFYIFFNGISLWNKTSSWGLYLSGSKYSSLTNLEVFITYLVTTISFFALPAINSKLLNKTNS